MSVVFVQVEPRGPSELVEIPVTVAGVSRVAIPDIQQLRSQEGQRIIIKWIRFITVEVLSNGVITGFVNAPITEAVKISLVLYCQGWEKGHYIPLIALNDIVKPTTGVFPYKRSQSDFDSWINVDWSKSFLQYSNGTGGVVLAGAAPYVVMLEVGYLKVDSQGRIIDVAS
jgi:hypothetical protein